MILQIVNEQLGINHGYVEYRRIMTLPKSKNKFLTFMKSQTYRQIWQSC